MERNVNDRTGRQREERKRHWYHEQKDEDFVRLIGEQSHCCFAGDRGTVAEEKDEERSLEEPQNWRTQTKRKQKKKREVNNKLAVAERSYQNAFDYLAHKQKKRETRAEQQGKLGGNWSERHCGYPLPHIDPIVLKLFLRDVYP